jgi:hypothetical protein
MTDAAALFTAKIPPGLFAAQAPSLSAPLGPKEGSGAISGGLLRPGAIDQATFLEMLQQQQQNRQAAGVGGKPVPMPIPSFQAAASAPAIPTLSSAQFAALIGARNVDPGLAATPAEGPGADPQTIAAAQQAQGQFQAQAHAAPMAPALKLSGTTNRNAPGNPQAGTLASADQAAADMPTISRRSDPQPMAAVEAAPSRDEMPTITRKGTPVVEASASEGTENKPADSDAENARQGDSNVVHFKSPPDKDQIKELRMRNKRWVVDETPGARQLFFGADGEFGWDDFLDLINPLQHIPGIAQIYRAVTGDEINGAANLLGAIPFGPLGGVGLIASVADLAVKDTSGEDIGGNLQAMLFGKPGTPENGTAAAADMAEVPETSQAAIQTAARETHYALSDSSERHAACRA